jgi:hypothetical protein
MGVAMAENVSNMLQPFWLSAEKSEHVQQRMHDAYLLGCN